MVSAPVVKSSVRVGMFASMYACVFAFACEQMCTCACMCVCVYVCMYVCMQTCGSRCSRSALLIRASSVQAPCKHRASSCKPRTFACKALERLICGLKLLHLHRARNPPNYPNYNINTAQTSRLPAVTIAF